MIFQLTSLMFIDVHRCSLILEGPGGGMSVPMDAVMKQKREGRRRSTESAGYSSREESKCCYFF